MKWIESRECNELKVMGLVSYQRLDAKKALMGTTQVMYLRRIEEIKWDSLFTYNVAMWMWMWRRAYILNVILIGETTYTRRRNQFLVGMRWANWKRDYLGDPDEEECDSCREAHVNHSESDWVREIEVPCREKPLMNNNENAEWERVEKRERKRDESWVALL